MMSKAGYGNRKQQKKSLKDVFSEATRLAYNENGIRKTPKAWQKKFTRLNKTLQVTRQAYSAYLSKVSVSGRDGDEDDLYEKPPFFSDVVHRPTRGLIYFIYWPKGLILGILVTRVLCVVPAANLAPPPAGTQHTYSLTPTPAQ